MKLLLSNGSKVSLPFELNTQERIELANKLIAENPLDFTYDDVSFSSKCGRKVDNDFLVKIRLDVLATYIIKGEEDYTETIMSRYKEKDRQIREMAFSQLSPDLQVNNGLE